MNNYIVPLSQVMKYIHPLRDKLFDPMVYLKEIDSAVNNPESNKNLSTDKKAIIDSIAHRVTHYYPQAIDLDFSVENIENGTFIATNLIDLTAAIYRHEKNVVCTINGQPNTVLSLLGIDINKPDNTVLLPKEAIDLEFNWEIDDSVVNNTWDNIDFVLDYIKSTPNNKSDTHTAIAEIIKFADSQVWNNSVLIEKLFNRTKELFNILPESIYVRASVLDFVQNNNSAFELLWNKCYKNLYTNEGVNTDYLWHYAKEDQEKIVENM